MEKLGKLNSQFFSEYAMPSGMDFDVFNPTNRGKLTRMNIHKEGLINLEKDSYKKLSDIKNFGI